MIQYVLVLSMRRRTCSSLTTPRQRRVLPSAFATASPVEFAHYLRLDQRPAVHTHRYPREDDEQAEADHADNNKAEEFVRAA